jgi:hypothetical protein
MTGDVVFMPGSKQIQLSPLQTAARDFGWMVNVHRDVCKVAASQATRKTVAVLFCVDALGRGYSWIETIRLFRSALPEARLLPCHGFSEPIDWPELCDAGAFHALWLPLRENEVRQSLGFVWEAEKRFLRSLGRLSGIAAGSSSPGEIQRLPPGRESSLITSSTAHAAG